MSREDVRYNLYRFGAHTAWWGAAAWSTALTWENLHSSPLKPPSDFIRVSGIFILLLMGVAIALGSALSRMRLGKTISGVFQTGLSIAVSMNNGRSGPYDAARAAIIRTDMDGVIKACESTEVIGWPEEGVLEGRPMDDLIPDTFVRVNHAALTQYRTAGNVGDSGVVISMNLPIMGADGKERPVRMTIARLGDTLIKTLVPLSVEK